MRQPSRKYAGRQKQDRRNTKAGQKAILRKLSHFIGYIFFCHKYTDNKREKIKQFSVCTERNSVDKYRDDNIGHGRKRKCSSGIFFDCRQKKRKQKVTKYYCLNIPPAAVYCHAVKKSSKTEKIQREINDRRKTAVNIICERFVRKRSHNA